jgi:sporulation protein YlmC with PRC-barrel domain
MKTGDHMDNLFTSPRSMRWMPAFTVALAVTAQAQTGAVTPGDAGRRLPGELENATAWAAPEQMVPWSIPASVLIGMPVVNPQNLPVGVIRDLVIATDFGRAPYAILAVDPRFLGIAGKTLAFPLTRLRPVGEGFPRALVANISRRSLQAAPGFDDNRWPDFDRDPYRAEADRYYYGSPSAFRDSRFVRASRMFGAEVLNNYETVYQDDIGEIRDLGIDLVRGRVRYVVVEYDPGLNSGDRLAVVPREDLAREDNEAGGVEYQTSRYDLRRAPAISPELWPQIALDSGFRRDFERYVQAR